MTNLDLVRIVAAAQFKDALRRAHRGSPFARIDGNIVAILAAGTLSVVAVAASVQAGSVGSRMGSTFGPGPIATTMSFGGALAAVAAMVAVSIWREQVRRESVRLGVLPIGTASIRFLSLVPALLPISLGMLVSGPSLATFAMTSRAGTSTLVTGVALGVCLTLLVHSLWATLVAVARPSAERAPTMLTLASLALMLVHAGWTATRQEGQDRWDAVANPVVWVLKRESGYTPWWMLGVSLLLALTLTLTGWVARGSARRLDAARSLEARHAAERISGLPVVARTPAWMIRLIWRQSSVVSEIGTAAILALLVAYLSSVLLGQGRVEHAAVGLFAMAGFCALPLLGIRSTLGPVPRLTALGARPADIRLGIIVAGAAFYVASAAPGVLLLLLRGVPMSSLGELILFATVIFSLTMSVGSVLRPVTTHSLGRSAAVMVTMLLLVGGLRAGIAGWPVVGAAIAAAMASAILGVVLGRTVTSRTVT